MYYKISVVCSIAIPHLNIYFTKTPKCRLRFSTVFFYSQKPKSCVETKFVFKSLIIKRFGGVTAGLGFIRSGHPTIPIISVPAPIKMAPKMR